MNCKDHGGPSHQMPGIRGGCTLCAMEKQTKDIIDTLMNKVVDESTKNMAFKAMLKPNHWHEIKYGTDGKVFIRSIPDNEIFIKSRLPLWKRIGHFFATGGQW